MLRGGCVAAIWTLFPDCGFSSDWVLRGNAVISNSSSKRLKRQMVKVKCPSCHQRNWTDWNVGVQVGRQTVESVVVVRVCRRLLGTPPSQRPSRSLRVTTKTVVDPNYLGSGTVPDLQCWMPIGILTECLSTLALQR